MNYFILRTWWSLRSNMVSRLPLTTMSQRFFLSLSSRPPSPPLWEVSWTPPTGGIVGSPATPPWCDWEASLHTRGMCHQHVLLVPFPDPISGLGIGAVLFSFSECCLIVQWAIHTVCSVTETAIVEGIPAASCTSVRNLFHSCAGDHNQEYSDRCSLSENEVIQMFIPSGFWLLFNTTFFYQNVSHVLSLVL